MTTRTKSLLGIFTAFALGGAGGGYLGWSGATTTMLDRALAKDATAIERYVDTLARMRADDPDSAIELLESWLDDVLIVAMEPSNFERRIDGRTVSQVGDAFVAARDYRSAHPRTSDRSFVDEMVANVFAAGEPR